MQRDVDSTIWDRPDFQALSPSSRLLYLHLRTSNLSHLSGLYQAPLSYLMTTTGLDREDVIEALGELSDAGFAHYDFETAFVLVLGMIRSSSPKINNAIINHLNRYVPQTFLVDVFLQGFPHFKDKLDRQNIVSKIILNGYANDTESIPKRPLSLSPDSNSISVSNKGEGGMGGGEKQPPKKKPSKKAKKAAKKTSPIVVSYNSFDIPKDFYEEILSDFKHLGEATILYQFKKASNYCEDHPDKYARNEAGKLTAFRVFLRNWLEKVKATPIEEGPAFSGYNPPRPDCPHCRGMGIESKQENGRSFGFVCRCRRPGYKPESVPEETVIEKDPSCDCLNGLRSIGGKTEVCPCIKKQMEGPNEPRQSRQAPSIAGL